MAASRHGSVDDRRQHAVFAGVLFALPLIPFVFLAAANIVLGWASTSELTLAVEESLDGWTSVVPIAVVCWLTAAVPLGMRWSEKP